VAVTASKRVVLVIDDERDLIDLLRYNLEREGFEVLGAPDGETGLDMALDRRPDVIVLDRMMPGPDGIDICRRLRQEIRTADVPVILLTAKSAEADRVMGLDAGADDYVTKPFSPRELVARIRARLRQPSPLETAPSIVRNGDLMIDENRREVTYGGKPVDLTPSEYRILQLLASCPGRVMFRRTSPQGELLLGSLAVRQRLLTREQRLEALAAQERNPSRKLGEIIVDRFYLAPQGLENLLEAQRQAFGESPEAPSGLLGRILIDRGLVTEYQVNEALRLQGRLVEANLHPVPPLGEILLKKGALGKEALAAALQLQNFMLYRCPECSARIGIPPGPGKGVLICPQCQAEVPSLFAKLAAAIHQVLQEAADAHAVEIPDEVIAVAGDPHSQFGKYVLVRIIGRGGVGVVWKAWQKDTNRFVALKILPSTSGGPKGPKTPFGNPEAVKRFFAEAQAIADLDYPNIVPLFDYGTAEDNFYYAMPYIDGLSLEKLLRGKLSELDLQGTIFAAAWPREPVPDEVSDLVPSRNLPLRFALEVVRDMALALDHAHAQGIIHRDIKPGNILIDRQGKPWLIDFGLARVARIGDSAYEKGITVGTPFYMPPEQAAGDMEQVDARSDVYSLGAVLYELVSGLYPFAGRSSDSAFDLVAVESPPPIEKVASDLPEDLARIVRRAMAREKDRRYPRAAEMARDLQECLDRVLGRRGA
jgi:DNA-binding response OmpR family regulator